MKKSSAFGRRFGTFLLASVLTTLSTSAAPMLNAPIDVGPDFFDQSNAIFVAKKLSGFDPATGKGNLTWDRHRWKVGYLFNNMTSSLEAIPGNEWPTEEYAGNPSLPFSVTFTSPRTIRLRLRTASTPVSTSEAPSIMLAGEPGMDGSWKFSRGEKSFEYVGAHGKIVIYEDPWRIEIRDGSGKLLTSTTNQSGGLPFSFVRRSGDYSRSVAATFSLSPGEKIMGLGESFGPLDKRGQRVLLWTSDVLGSERPLMYKPIPFFLSNRGYGMFIHTSSPITADVGSQFLSNNTLLVGDENLDLFIFLGDPKEVLNEYTTLTGKSPMPPLWSFGLWMSRITYKSETEVRTVAKKLRENRIPSDVIHLDTGWFQTDWRCDYQFAKDRFENPQKMIDDLKVKGFRTSLWQLPYFVPKNDLFPEIVSKGLAVHDIRGGLTTEDAILDFSNPEAVKWYQGKLGHLLKMGVGAIKTDFGEAAPASGLYASGRPGFYEHNLYPLRYQKAVAEVTREVSGENIIWARAGWAGSQRYPLHWSGDSPCTDGSMAATLRAGLSLGSCGFTFWSHDIGGFFGRPNPELYKRWAAFGLLSSHSRCHGDPPREPWEYGEQFNDDFRLAVEMKYRLMPYIYAQAKDASERGLPMLRALYIEFPDDPGSWRVDDQYLLGSSLLVAPLLEENTTSRDVYLPPGEWVDYQTGQRYAGGAWHHLKAGPVAAVMLVKAGTILPRAAVAQSTKDIDWKNIELAVYPLSDRGATGLVALPGEGRVHTVSAERASSGQYELKDAKALPAASFRLAVEGK